MPIEKLILFFFIVFFSYKCLWKSLFKQTQNELSFCYKLNQHSEKLSERVSIKLEVYKYGRRLIHFTLLFSYFISAYLEIYLKRTSVALVNDCCVKCGVCVCAFVGQMIPKSLGR